MGTIEAFFGLPSELHVVYSGSIKGAPGYEYEIGSVTHPKVTLTDSKLKNGDLVFIVVTNPARNMSITINGVTEIYRELDDEDFPRMMLINSIYNAQNNRIEIIMSPEYGEEEDPEPDWEPSDYASLLVFLTDYNPR